MKQTIVFPIFEELLAGGFLSPQDLQSTKDGFTAVTKSIADILINHGITTFPNDNNEERECSKFYDDWYLYSICMNGSAVTGLFKMREQEFDCCFGDADGDSPGVTVSFIAFDDSKLLNCLLTPSFANRKALNREINRVVSARGQAHHPLMKAYFVRPEAEAPYLIAELYTSFIASLSENGKLSVPEAYHQASRRRNNRLSAFLDKNNQDAKRIICDHQFLYLEHPQRLSEHEKRAILATHSANTSFHSFAAEIRFHALFLTPLAKIPIPFLWRSPYDSAIRADLSIDDSEFQGPTPYYRENGAMVHKQKQAHPEY